MSDMNTHRKMVSTLDFTLIIGNYFSQSSHQFLMLKFKKVGYKTAKIVIRISTTKGRGT